MILITGGTGYIGSHTCVELLNQNEDIIIIDDLSNSSIDVLDKIQNITGVKPKFYKGSVLDLPLLDKIFTENTIDSVIHFASFKSVGESVSKPIEYYQNNINGLLTLLKAMQKHNCNKIVFSSSATVYGIHNPAPMDETMPTSATNPYGWTKVMSEQILTDCTVANSNFKVMLLRYFNPVGAHSSGLIGENPKGIPNNIMPYISKVATGELECINIFGDDYDTPDGTGVRDYIHVVDLALGHIKALEKLDSMSGVKIYNLGTGNGYSVKQLIDCYEKACNKQLPSKITQRRQGDIASCYACPTKANIELNWHATKNLLQMCKDSWNYTIKNI